MSAVRSVRDRLRAVFRREAAPGPPVWQPRLYYWYYANRLPNRLPAGWYDQGLLVALEEHIAPFEGVVPEHLRGRSLLEIYRILGASPRYAPEVLGVEVYRQQIVHGKVRVYTEERDGFSVTELNTPHGILRQVSRCGSPVEYALKGVEDMPALRDVIEATSFEFDPAAYRVVVEAFGDDGIPQSCHPRTPLMRLFHDFAGLETGIGLLYTYPDETHALLKDMAAWDDHVYRVIAESPQEIIAFGENLDANFVTPRLFEEHLAPYYAQRVQFLHGYGKFCHLHADGTLKPLLPLLRLPGFDGIEAATPLPQGDVTLEELKEALGDTILLDGIPAVLFCPYYPLETLMACIQRILELFSPNLILGASDEVPPDADIDRVRLVGEILEARTRL